MKRTFTTPTAIALFIMMSGFGLTGLSAQETRDLKPFTGIGIGISADVFYTSGNTHEIKIEGNDRDVKDLITEVEDGYLKLRYDDWNQSRSKLTIHIASAELEKVSVSGSAQFKAEKPVSAEEMSIAISGSGSILFSALDAKELDVKISGSGNTILEKGTAEEMDAKISGSGKILAEHFEVEEFSAAISGSGSCRITVKDELEARLSGSGSVYYHGNPQVNTVASGSGKVKSL
ncbi:MAG: head GIN domain-containing protein [Bacteroidota bacterium]